jgi:hypothetical protein
VIRTADGRRAVANRDEITALGRAPRSDVTVSRAVPPSRVAAILGVSDQDQSCVRRARLMYADNTPVQMADSYIPLDIAVGTAIEDADSGPGGIISPFADLGLAQARITEEIGIRPPSAHEVEFLKMSPDQRVYDVTHTGWTADGQAVEVCLHVMQPTSGTLNTSGPPISSTADLTTGRPESQPEDLRRDAAVREAAIGVNGQLGSPLVARTSPRTSCGSLDARRDPAGG